MIAALGALFSSMGLFDLILLMVTLVPVISAAVAKFFNLGVGKGTASGDGEEKKGSGWLKRLGIVGSIIATIFFTRGWLARFPGWLKTLFAEGGRLYFVQKFFLRAIFIFRHPVMIVLGLLISAVFPSVLEYFFLIVGYVGVKLLMVFFRIGKNLFTSSEGNAAMDQLRENIVQSVDVLPPCMVQVMGYLHVVENLGIFITTFVMMIAYAAFRRVYGTFFIKAGTPLV